MSEAARLYLRQLGGVESDDAPVHILSSIGVDCYATPNGDAWSDTYNLEDYEAVSRRTPGARIMALVCGAKHHPVLAELLPQRTDAAVDCPACSAAGHVTVGGALQLICYQCCGLGWCDTNLFQPEEP